MRIVTVTLNVVVFEQTFTDTEVVLFHLLLSTLHGLTQHVVFEHFSFLET